MNQRRVIADNGRASREAAASGPRSDKMETSAASAASKHGRSSHSLTATEMRTAHAGGTARQGHPRGVHARQHGRPRNAAGVNARQHACPSAQRNTPQRTPSRPPRLDIPDPRYVLSPAILLDPTRDHITQNHYIQDGRRNARCAALSTWGEAHSRQWQLHG